MNVETRERLRFALDAASFDGGKDEGAFSPGSDAEDQMWGARFVPGPVTLARRAGQKVRFVHDCRCPNCWYWLFLDADGFAPGEKKPRKKKFKGYGYDPYFDSHLLGMDGMYRQPSTRLYIKPGQRIMHFDPYWLTILKEQGGKCECGNTHIRGGSIGIDGKQIEDGSVEKA